MFGQVGPTPYDLAFSVFGIPVRVIPTFWLVAVLMGRSTWQAERYDLMLVWVACLFVSILIHELGHAVVANRFGWPPEVYLYHFGGLAVFSPYHGYTTGRSIAVSFAGPAAGFILFGLVWGVRRAFYPGWLDWDDPAQFAIIQLQWINLGWGLVNLLPVLPLDGGQISRAICERVRRYGGLELSLKIGIAVSGAAAAYFVMNREAYGLFPALLFGMLCFQNVQMLQAPRM